MGGTEGGIDALFSISSGPTDQKGKRHTYLSHPEDLSIWGWKDFVRRDELVDPSQAYVDDEGTLLIDFAIQVYEEVPTVWYPPKMDNRFRSCLETMLTSRPDVTYVVSHKDFHLHRSILAEHAPAMCELCIETDQVVTLDARKKHVLMF